MARRCGAMVIGVGDTEQLDAVDAGGIFRLIAARHGHWKLTEVRRFRHAWERDASLRLRDGDVAALAEYDARGRIYHGPQDRVFDDAVTLCLNDYLAGQGVPADGHVERDGGPAGRPGPRAAGRVRAGRRRLRSRWRTATGPGAVTWSGPG